MTAAAAESGRTAIVGATVIDGTGGSPVKDGVIVPKYSHGEVIEAVFRRTRVTVAIMTAINRSD